MPYISQEQRNHIDIEITELIRKIRQSDEIWGQGSVDGILNYSITRIVGESLKPVDGWRYWILARAYAVFMAAGAEFYRRLLAPYENSKSDVLDLPLYAEATVKNPNVQTQREWHAMFPNNNSEANRDRIGELGKELDKPIGSGNFEEAIKNLPENLTESIWGPGTSEEFIEGYNAFCKGLGRKDNPYVGSVNNELRQEKNAWIDGWVKGKAMKDRKDAE